MSYPHSVPVARRGFLVRLSQAAAALSAIAANPERLAAVSGTSADPDAWIDRLKGQNKVMIHVHQYFGTALVDARNMLANGRDFYGVPETQNSIAVITHGPAIGGLFRDEIWEKFALGTFYKVNDSKTGAPATRNIYLIPQDGDPPDAAVPELVKRGVTFVVCNVAMRTLSKRLAKTEGDPDTIYTQLNDGLVDGAFLVPDVFVSMQRAQKRGVSYIFTDRSR